jgi:hypothetical protein
MSIGLTKQEMETRNKESLIKYIGVLQTELQMIYEQRLPAQNEEIVEGLDFSCPDTLKSTA